MLVQLVGYGTDAVAMVIRIRVHLGLCQLAVCRMGKCYGSRLVSKCISCHSGIVTAHQVVFGSFSQATTNVVMVHRSNLLGTTEYRHYLTCQQSLAVGESSLGIVA